LQQRRKQNAEQHRQEGILQGGDHMNKCFGFGQRRNGGFHQSDALKQHTKAHDDGAHILYHVFFHKQVEHCAHKQNHRRIGTEVKRCDLGGDGGADVGAHNHANGLGQGHQPGVYKADDHHVCGRGALNQHGDGNAHHHRDYLVLGSVLQNHSEVFTAGVF